MLVQEARAVARTWVVEEASRLPGFYGAYFAGSTSWLPDDAVLPATSDLDVNVVFTARHAPHERDKLVHRGVLLELTPLSLEELRSADIVLGHYHLAGGLSRPGVILDPSGHLTRLQEEVSRKYARREWVRRRCDHARRRVLEGLATMDESAPLHEQAICWLFPTGVTAHILLVAGLRNPTVRRRYLSARELLAEYRCLPFYEILLELLGCDRMSRARVEEHLDALTAVFDATRAVIRGPFAFASDISALARPLAIDGSRELVERGFHREAVFWIAVTYSRCQTVLAADAPELKRRFDPAYRRLLGDLGGDSFPGLRQRGEQVKAHLPRVWEAAEGIMAANPEIEE